MYIIYLSGGETDHILQFCSQGGPAGEEINGEVNQLTVGQRSRQTGPENRIFFNEALYDKIQITCCTCMLHQLKY